MDSKRPSQKPKQKRPSIFFRNLNKEGPGISKQDAVITYGFKGFFSLYFRRFGTLFSINLLYVLGNFPLLLALFATSGNVFATQTLTHGNVIYPVLHGVMISDMNPVKAALNGVFGSRSIDYVLHSGAYIMLGIGLALFCITFGLVNVGCAYLLRNIVKGDPVFLMSDFFYAIKRNFKQALPMGILDLLFLYVLYQDILFWYLNARSFLYSYLFYFSILLALFYFVVRFYLYEMMVTFRLSLFKLIKNSAIFAFWGIKRNLVGLLGIIVFCLFCFGIFYTYVPLGIILPFTIMISTCAFIAVFTAWPNIKKVMIDPYQDQHGQHVEDDGEAPIFRDDVTQREREAEMKKRHGHS